MEFIFFRALPSPPSGGCGSGASGLPALRLLRCAQVCALTRAPYRPLAQNAALTPKKNTEVLPIQNQFGALNHQKSRKILVSSLPILNLLVFE
jgi:hypothetical protein